MYDSHIKKIIIKKNQNEISEFKNVKNLNSESYS